LDMKGSKTWTCGKGRHGLLKYHPDPACLTLLHPAVRPPLKRPYGRFKDGLPAGQAACSRLLPLRTPHAVHLGAANQSLMSEN
jgi:hypothetical protein